MFDWFNFKKDKKIDNEFVYVIGDSHTRAFSFNNNFLPLFIGAGKKHCFINNNCMKNAKSKIYKITRRLNKANVIIVLGEPDTRYYLGKGWYPWEGQMLMDIDDFKPLVDASFERFKKMYQFLSQQTNNRFFLLNITPSERIEQNLIVNYFNDLLTVFFQGSDSFIEINSTLYKGSNIIDRKYLGDTVHLNNKIQPIVENKLIKLGILTESNFDKVLEWDHHIVHSNFSYDKKFGCYTLKQ